ncbi:FHA domain family protein [Leishmania donovani]|uniref:FHA domain family protein n=1 Tax=Leishmania donovani TaxID=5661 RepID=A0A504Y3Y6_LEIDO|nr:FHA domain family protein [Leishmania donovani]
MANDVEVDFVLVRGPWSLDRRMRVTLPSNGTPVTVGRATHCAVLLDPSLLFSSQVQCSLFAMQVKSVATAPSTSTATTATETPMTADASSTPNHACAGGTAPHCEDTPIDAADTLSTPRHQPTLRDGGHVDRTTRVYITDMCSSNGTFVNGIRISGTDPTELNHGDVCIFGGMRDVAVGEALPPDAYDGPELVQWRVDLRLSAERPPETFEYTSTPLVLPARGVLEVEERALLDTAQRSLAKPMPSSMRTPASATPAAATVAAVVEQRSLDPAVAGSAAHCLTAFDIRCDTSPRGVPQQLFTSPISHEKDATREAAEEVEEAQKPSSSGRRSVSLVASQDARVTSMEAVEETSGVEDTADSIHTPLADPVAIAVPAEPPAAVVYDAVRLGNVSYDARGVAREERDLEADADADVDRDVESATPSGKQRRRDSPASATPPKQKRVRHEDAAVVAPTQLTFTPMHIKWTMPNPNEMWSRLQRSPGRATKPFYVMLPVTSLATVVVCPERLGIAVELKDGCQLPLVDAAVLSGSAESRWVVWELSQRTAAVPVPADEARSSGRGRSKVTKGNARRACKRTEKTPSVAAEPTHTATADVEKSPLTPAARFEAWLMHFKLYYAAQKVPAPVVVDGAAFDVILVPKVHTDADATVAYPDVGCIGRAFDPDRPFDSAFGQIYPFQQRVMMRHSDVVEDRRLLIVTSSSPASPPQHVVLEDDGEYFDEDPTVGRGVPKDTAGEMAWKPMQPVAASDGFMAAIKQSLLGAKGPAPPTTQ